MLVVGHGAVVGVSVGSGWSIPAKANCCPVPGHTQMLENLVQVARSLHELISSPCQPVERAVGIGPENHSGSLFSMDLSFPGLRSDPPKSSQ